MDSSVNTRTTICALESEKQLMGIAILYNVIMADYFEVLGVRGHLELYFENAVMMIV